jgi:hypothetical protein
LRSDYDKDLAENHRTLRQIMGIGDWNTATEFNWRQIRDNVCAVRVETLDEINQLVVRAGDQRSAAGGLSGLSDVLPGLPEYPPA